MAEIVEAYPGNEEPLVGQDTDLRFNFSIDGVLTNPDAYDINIVSARTGVAVTTSGTETIDTGELAVNIPATSLTDVDIFTATLDATTTGTATVHQFIFDYEVRSHPLYTLAEVRDHGIQKLTAAKFPDEEILRTRKLITEQFEEYCNVAFSPKYTEFTMDGPDAGGFRQFLLFVPATKITAVTKVEINGTAFDAGELADLRITEGGSIYNPSGWTFDIQSIVVGVEHGYPFPPRDVRRAGITYTQNLLTPGKIVERAIILTDETGTWRLQQAKMPDRPTGFPDIDFILNQTRETVV